MDTQKNLIEQYRNLELQAHVELDDVMNKVTQECGEVVEAHENNDLEERHKESCDVLVNVLSVADSLGVEVNINEREYESPIRSSKLLMDLADWNTKIQAFRGRYARKKETLENVSASTHNLVQSILSFSKEGTGIEEMIQTNLTKFSSRVSHYLGDVDLKDYIDTIVDFPKKGINFYDISPLLKNEEAMRYITFELANKCKSADVIVGLDARGFLFGERVAELLGKPFVMVRKKGKLPGDTHDIDYGLEYGNDGIEIQKKSLEKGQKVALIDDLLATGGTMEAAVRLVERTGALVDTIAFAIALNSDELVGRESRTKLKDYRVEYVLDYNS